jgi:hypothetical protein
MRNVVQCRVLGFFRPLRAFDLLPAGQHHSALDDIPHSLPALMRAHKIQRRCSAVGFDWTSLRF